MKLRLPPPHITALAAGTALGIGLATWTYLALGWITVTLR